MFDPLTMRGKHVLLYMTHVANGSAESHNAVPKKMQHGAKLAATLPAVLLFFLGTLQLAHGFGLAYSHVICLTVGFWRPGWQVSHPGKMCA